MLAAAPVSNGQAGATPWLALWPDGPPFLVRDDLRFIHDPVRQMQGRIPYSFLLSMGAAQAGGRWLADLPGYRTRRGGFLRDLVDHQSDWQFRLELTGSACCGCGMFRLEGHPSSR